jgi:aryl-alcohol dehydrogenase-like predicted oxidoreductase
VQQIILPGTDLTLSRFVFGTASLFNVGPRKKRLRLLDAAKDHGFTHFDTAPYYGFGMAERDLQPLLAAHPDVTFTTKVGIYSPGGESQPGLAVLLRKAGGRLLPALSRPTIDWSILHARKSLEGSLRRIGRSSIDLYMLHEPELPLLNTDEWLRWLEQEVAAGRVRRFGLAIDASRLAPFMIAKSPLGPVIQTTDSLDDREADILLRNGRPLQITYGYVSAARKRHSKVDVPAILTRALNRNPDGAIIVSTGRIERLKQYGKILRAIR